MNELCSVERLQSALAGSLSEVDEAALSEHLQHCEACGSTMERLAADPCFCRDAATLLKSDALDEELHDDEAADPDGSLIDFCVEYLEPSDDPSHVGRLGGYDVTQIIGRGGMGIVLRAFDRDLKRQVAIKVLAPHLAHSAVARKRFAREAQAAAAVVHPHVLAIHQVQPNGRLPFFVMPLVSGESLAERLAAQGPLELNEVLRIGMQAAAGLAAAHEQGLVHRDVKPANILLERGVERAVLTDFGLARAADDLTMTRWGMIAGTPQYMSPEQARGESLDGRSDLFSLGCVLYEMATGVSPFKADSTIATLRRLVEERPQPLASLCPEVPRWFVLIVERLLEKDPARRFESAAQVSELLAGCLAHVQQPASVVLPETVRLLERDNRSSKSMQASFGSRRGWFASVVIALVLLIGGGTVFGLLGISEKDAKKQSEKNLARISAALESFRQAHNDRFPPSAIAGRDGKGGPLHSWRVAILPYLGYQKLHDAYRFDEAWDSAHNKALLSQMPDVFRSPFDDSTNASYFGVTLAGHSQPRAITLGEPAPTSGSSPQSEPPPVEMTEFVRSILKEKPSDVTLNINPFDVPQIIRHADRQFANDLIAVAEQAVKEAKDRGKSYVTAELLLHQMKARVAELDSNPDEQLKQLQIVRVLFDLLGQQTKNGEYVFLTKEATELLLRPRLAETHTRIATLKNDLREQTLCLEDWVVVQGELVKKARDAHVDPQTAEREWEQIRRWLAAARAAKDQLFEGRTVFSGSQGTQYGSIGDGAANTIAIIEAKRDIPWTKPEDFVFDPRSEALQLGGWYRSGWYAAFADATVRWFPNDTNHAEVRNLLTILDRDGGTGKATASQSSRNPAPTAAQMAAMLDLLTRYPQHNAQTVEELKQLSAAQFEAVAVLRDLPFQKATGSEGESRFHFTTGDGHTVIVMFRNNQWAGVQRVRGERPLTVGGNGKATSVGSTDQPPAEGMLTQQRTGPRRTGASTFVGNAIEVTGTTQGNVWGTDIYTADSDLNAAAVHAGVVAVGETRRIYIEIVEAPKSYEGSTRNGVMSMSYGTYVTAIKLHKSRPPIETLTRSTLQFDRSPSMPGRVDNAAGQTRAVGRIGELTVLEITGAKDGTVWGTHTYTADSDLATAIVHAGLASVGEKRMIAVEVVTAPKSYRGSTRNGITSLHYSQYPTAIRLYDITLKQRNPTDFPSIVDLPPVRLDDEDRERFTERLGDRPGVVFVREVTGSESGKVWGTDVYTGDSDLAAAAVHAGLLKVGETGWICREVVPTQKSYTGTTRNGVTSLPFDEYPVAIKLRRVEGPAPAHRLQDYQPLHSYGRKPPTLSSYLPGPFGPVSTFSPDKPGTKIVVEVRGSTTGAVWGTDFYTADSDMATAAVHAGLLKPDEVGWISREVVPTQKLFRGSTRNGVTSLEYGEYPVAIKLARVAAPMSSSVPSQHQPADNSNRVGAFSIVSDSPPSGLTDDVLRDIREPFLRRTGDTPIARKLFDRVADDAHRVAVLRESITKPETRSRLYADELWRVWREAAQSKQDGGVPAADAALCFYLGCDPVTAKSLSEFPAPPDANEGFRAHETMLISMAVVGEIFRPETRDPFDKLIAQWTACRADPFVRQHSLEIARAHRLKEMVPVVRAMSSDAAFEPRFRAAAITLLAELGGRPEIPSLCKLLDDTSECYARSLSIKGEDAPTAKAQVRDVALGCLLVLAGESIGEAGIDEHNWHRPPQPFTPSELFRMAPFGYFSAETRKAAHAKWDDKLRSLNPQRIPQ